MKFVSCKFYCNNSPAFVAEFFLRAFKLSPMPHAHHASLRTETEPTFSWIKYNFHKNPA